MAKKNNKKVTTTSQSESLKASKNKKNDLSRLIKVLRPKVYITDSSSFKSLVQGLTGNVSPPQAPTMEAPVNIIDITDADESSFEASDSSDQTMLNQTSLGGESNHLVCYDDEVIDLGGQQKQVHDLGLDLFDYWDIDSWLLNSTTDPYTSVYDDGFDQLIHHDVSIYDYEFSGML